jgi:hypothetical protein|tara:strand:+ start:5054 stop:6685 length:1632 start_codon:yes stop_codon:yes gene_type:complete
MNFKRPSFKKGGSTGIGQLTPRTQARGGGNIGGGIIAGSNLGSRTGFSVLDIISGSMAEELTGGSNKISSKADALKKSNVGLKKGNIGSRLLTQLRGLSIPSASTTGLMSLPFVGPAALAYMNRPRTLEEKKVMQEYGPIDETFFQYDEYDADRKKARGVGEEISFIDALFMDPETGKYPKVLGRTKDRKKIEELFGTDAGYLPNAGPKEVNIEEIVDTVVSDKKTGTKDDDTPKKAPSFEDTYEAEKKKIERLIGEEDNKGIVALALSDAIGTPGTIADKAAVLNKTLLGIMAGKKKDQKDIAKLAYTATKEIEKAKIASGKEGFSERQFKEMAKLRRIITDTTGAYSDAEKAEAAARYKNQTEVLKAIGGKSTAEKVMKPGDAREQIKRFKDGAKKLAKMDKNDPNYGRALNEYMAEIEFLSNYPELMPSIRRIDAIYANVLAANKKDGGRIGFANGTPMEESIQVSETVGQSQVPTAQTPQLSFEEIRNRLPKEITDEIVRLIAGSNEALQDFSYIRTQGDVDKFNMKYGVTLVLPQSTA